MTKQNARQHGDIGDITGQVVDIRDGPSGEATTAIKIETISGSSGWLLFASDSPGREYSWETGHWYRIEEVVGCDPEQALQSREERVMAAFTDISGSGSLASEQFDPTICPSCGGTVGTQGGIDIDQQVRDLLEATSAHVHGIGRASLPIEALGSDAIDWRPQPDQHSRRRRTTGTELVCLDCGEDVSRHYRQQIEEKRRAGRDEEVVENIDADLTSDQTFDAFESQPMDNASMASAGDPASSATADVGMATGGAKDATNFRDNIREGYVPAPDSLSYEGLFYDYYFDTGDTDSGESLFYPSYSMAVTESPISNEIERYLTVGLNSNLTEADLERKPLNLVAVLDVSGSMSSSFDQYYYDEHGNRQEPTSENRADSKMAAARQALSALTEQPRDEDRLGIVLYNSTAHVAKPLRRVGETNMDAIRGHIQEIAAGGGTDMSAGFSAAMDLLEPHHGADLADVENRVVFLTDAMPNRGTTGRAEIVDEFDAAAAKHVHTTFVGVGLDANADLVESISGVRGANHYFIHSTDEFRQRLADEFTYMVTPLVFDLSLEVVSEGYEIEEVYGSPNADRATGEVMHVTTLFPSPTSDGDTRGGVTLLKLSETRPDPSLEVVANWTERDGTQGRDVATLSFPPQATEQFDNTGIRKAVLLSRYGRLLREWMGSIRQDGGEIDDKRVDDWNDRDTRSRGEWEEQSVPLAVTPGYREQFATFFQHMISEIEEIDDETLGQDLEMLELISDVESSGDIERAMGLTEKERTRLQNIIELQPTSNSELQTEWGLEESADVHYYLENHLDEFYYRDEANRIRAIEDPHQH